MCKMNKNGKTINNILKGKEKIKMEGKGDEMYELKVSKKLRKREKGITLIALVITVIVLLILARHCVKYA